MTRYHFTKRSDNRKTGPMPVSITTADTCPDNCTFKGNGCYAESGPLLWHWRKVSERGTDLDGLCASIRSLPEGTVWRHNQAGDLPGSNNQIDVDALSQLVRANRGRSGFTYTHKPMNEPTNRLAVWRANRSGFTINLSADNDRQADALADTGAGPVCVVCPETQTTNYRTPAGRLVVICPAMTHDNVSCATCKLCAWSGRETIVGFPAHGSRKRTVSNLVSIGGHNDQIEA